MRSFLALAVLVALISAGGAEAKAQTASRPAATGLSSARVTINGHAMLRQFTFNFLGSSVDHHLRQISVLPDPAQNLVRVGFFDKNFDDRPRPIICQNFVFERTILKKTRFTTSGTSIPVSSISTEIAICGARSGM